MNRIVIMAKNDVGVIADISRALAGAEVNIETINAEALGEKGVITLTTDDYDDALRALTDAGFKTVSGRLANSQAPGRARRSRKGGRRVQAGGGEHSEPPHSGAQGGLHHRSPIGRRSSQGGGAGGPRHVGVTRAGKSAA